MKQELNSIRIELEVVAVQMGMKNIWMQGDIVILIHGEKPYSESDIVSIDALLESFETDGVYFIFSCSCGIPACGGWEDGIRVSHQGQIIKWEDLGNNRTWYFDKKQIKDDLKTIRKEVKNFKHFFNQKGIEYVGVDYDILNAFLLKI
jgi:hypothetical protein